MADFDFTAHAKYQPPGTPGVPNLAGYHTAIASMIREGYASIGAGISKMGAEAKVKQKEKEVGTAFEDLTNAYNDTEMWETKTVRPADSTSFKQFINQFPGDLAAATDAYVDYLEKKKGIDRVEGRHRADTLLEPYTVYVAKPGTSEVVEAYENKLRTLGVPEAQITAMRGENMHGRYLNSGDQLESARMRGGILEGTSAITEGVGRTLSTARAGERVTGETFSSALDREGKRLEQQLEISGEAKGRDRAAAFEFTAKTFSQALGLEVERAKALGEAGYEQKKAQMRDQNVIAADAMASVDEVVGDMTATMVGGRDLEKSERTWPNFDILQADIEGMEKDDPLKALGDMASSDMGTASFITQTRYDILIGELTKKHPDADPAALRSLLDSKLQSMNTYVGKNKALQAVDEMLAPITSRSGKVDYLGRQGSLYGGGGGGYDKSSFMASLLSTNQLARPMATSGEGAASSFLGDDPAAAMESFIGNPALAQRMRDQDVSVQVVDGQAVIVPLKEGDPKMTEAWLALSREYQIPLMVDLISKQTGLSKAEVHSNLPMLHAGLMNGSLREVASKIANQAGGPPVSAGSLPEQMSDFTGTTDGKLQSGTPPWR